MHNVRTKRLNVLMVLLIITIERLKSNDTNVLFHYYFPLAASSPYNAY